MKVGVQRIFDRLFSSHPALNSQSAHIRAAFELLSRCYHGLGTVLICGNGGSAADSEHIVSELMKEFLIKRPLPLEEQEKIKHTGVDNAASLCQGLQVGLPAISLVSHSGLFTAFCNDVNHELVFAQQVCGYGRPGDVLLAISTSGNSRNVINAVAVAKAKGLGTIGLTGSRQSKLHHHCEVTISAPSEQTFEIQEYHLPIYHALCAMLEEEFFGQPAQISQDTAPDEVQPM
jgi:phosphoheptose isomerase